MLMAAERSDVCGHAAHVAACTVAVRRGCRGIALADLYFDERRSPGSPGDFFHGPAFAGVAVQRFFQQETPQVRKKSFEKT